ncbi:hypothetical protein [Paraliomyxa miuraensis]|uniref:hypothetical protein n=1 Tax=Paraliomyxa miuraensis TaxID=376150 RepID=UPI00224F8286|nr:hypothetical protein [Paraliomyxa miuraensis]MCX4242749.1 hypothetical protein [Paraliomyxa miuraensis]
MLHRGGMCRYGFAHYKPHHACFACRKAFKRRLRDDVDPSGDEHPARCPECGALMAEMGLDFQAPPRGKVKAWRVLETLWEVGETFHSCGCGGPGYRPRDPAALRAFLREIIAGYRRNLTAWQAETEPRRAENRLEAIAAWSRRIARAEAALQRLEG